MDCLVLALNAGATHLHEPVMDCARGHHRIPDWQLSPRSARYSGPSLFAGAIFGPHDGRRLGADGPFANVDGLVCRQFYSVGIGAIWRCVLPQLAITVACQTKFPIHQSSRLPQMWEVAQPLP